MAEYINEKGLDLVLQKVSEKIHEPIVKWKGTEEEFAAINTPLNKNSLYVITNTDGLLTDIVLTGKVGNVVGITTQIEEDTNGNKVMYLSLDPDQSKEKIAIKTDDRGNFEFFIDPQQCGERAIDFPSGTTIQSIPTIESVTRLGDSVKELPGYRENSDYTSTIKYPAHYPNAKKSMPFSKLKSMYVTDTSSSTSISDDIDNLDTNEWDVWSFKYMFNYVNDNGKAIDVAKLARFNKVEDMSNAFQYCKSISNLDQLDTSNVRNMSNMFRSYKGTSLDVSNLDVSQVKDTSSMFSYSSKLVSLTLPQWNNSRVENASQMFYGCSSLTGTLDLTNFVTSKTTNIERMFSDCSANVIGLNTWDTSNLTQVSIPQSLSSDTDIKNWNTSKLQKFYIINTKLTSIDLSNWDTKNLRGFSISNNSLLESINLSNWDTKNLGKNQTNVLGVFQNNPKLITITGLENLNTSNIPDNCGIQTWFYNCKALESIDLSSFKLDNKSLDNTFEGCTSLRNIIWPEGNINMYSSTSIGLYCTFRKCSSLVNLDLSNFYYTQENNGKSVTFNAFQQCTSLQKLYIPNLIFSYINSNSSSNYPLLNCTSLNYVKCCKEFRRAALNDLSISSAMQRGGDGIWDIVDDWELEDLNNPTDGDIIYTIDPYYISTQISVNNAYVTPKTVRKLENGDYICAVDLNEDLTNCINMFVNPRAVSKINKFPNTSKVTNMEGMFSYCKSLEHIDLSQLDFSKTESLKNFLYNCSSLKEIDLTPLNTATNCTNFINLLSYCYSLEEVDLTYLNNPNINSLSGWFSNNTSLQKVILPIKITEEMSLYNTFYECSSLTTINNLDKIKKITNLSNTFYNCTALTSLNLSGWDTSNVTNMNSMFRGCNSLNFIRCKQAFKNWCITNQDNIYLPTQMKEGTGIWDIIDLDQDLNKDQILTYLQSIPLTAMELDTPPTLHFPEKWLDTIKDKELNSNTYDQILGDVQEVLSNLDTAGFIIKFGENYTFDSQLLTSIEEIQVEVDSEVVGIVNSGNNIEIKLPSEPHVLTLKTYDENHIQLYPSYSIYSKNLSPSVQLNLESFDLQNSEYDDYLSYPCTLKVACFKLDESDGSYYKVFTTINIS